LHIFCSLAIDLTLLKNVYTICTQYKKNQQKCVSGKDCHKYESKRKIRLLKLRKCVSGKDCHKYESKRKIRLLKLRVYFIYA